MIVRVVLSKRAQRDLRKVPRHVVDKLTAWVKTVGLRGHELQRDGRVEFVSVEEVNKHEY